MQGGLEDDWKSGPLSRDSNLFRPLCLDDLKRVKVCYCSDSFPVYSDESDPIVRNVEKRFHDVALPLGAQKMSKRLVNNRRVSRETEHTRPDTHPDRRLIRQLGGGSRIIG